MAIESKPVRPTGSTPPRGRRSTAVPPGRAELPNDAGRAVATSQRAAAPPPSPAAGGSSDRDRGIELLIALVVAALLMVVAAAILAVVGRWWVLVPVMLVDFVATFAVIASIVHLLKDGGDARV